MEGIHGKPLDHSGFEQKKKPLTTINDTYFANRKVAINHDSLISICTGDNIPFRERVKTLFAVASNSRFTPDLDNQNDKNFFSTWFFGSDCPVVASRDKDFLCPCHQAHKDYPGEKVGGVSIENERLLKAFSENKKQNRNKETAKKANSLLSVAACNLIKCERLIKNNPPPKATAADSTKTDHEAIIKVIEKKYKESEELFEEAYEMDQDLTQNQLRSWLIQYAISKKLINQANDIEKIKNFRDNSPNKLSDQWFTILTKSGFYPNTETLASPVYLAEQFCLISQELIRVNFTHPRQAFESAILLFSKFDSLSAVFHQKTAFLPQPDNDYHTLLDALSMAIFADEAKLTNQQSKFSEELMRSCGISTSTTSSTIKTKATTSKSLSWNIVDNTSGDMEKSQNIASSESSGTTSACPKVVKKKSKASSHKQGANIRLELQSVTLKTKKPGQDETSTTWLTEPENLAEPKDPITEALANIFNIMTYPKSDDKTRIYNMPDHKKRMNEAYKLLDKLQQDTTADNLHGYSCFLMGWLHEQQLIDQPSPVEAARFYNKATERGLFIPLNLKAGDLYAEIEDYQSACQCYENMHKSLLELACPASTNESKAGLNDTLAVQSGYLSQSFQDFLQSKIEYFKLKAKETIYLKDLSPEEVQRFINGEKNSASPSSNHPKAIKTVHKINFKRSSKEVDKDVDKEVSEKPDNDTQSVTSTAQNPQSPTGTDKPISENSKHIDGRFSASNFANQIDLQVMTIKQKWAKEKCNIIRNRLAKKWDSSIHAALKFFLKEKKKATYTHEENISWLDEIIEKYPKKRGVEALREHLAWEHIHIAEESQFDNSVINSKKIIGHLNKARDLLLSNIVKKTGIPYKTLPEPTKFERDVLDIIELVTFELSYIEIDEWRFGIVCQARSLGHVYSTFKLLYPKSQNTDSLNRGWFSLKHLYQTTEIVD